MIAQALEDAGAWWDGTRAERAAWYPDRLEPGLQTELQGLLSRYADELRELDRVLRDVLAHVGVSQFADGEGALLYCALRELRPRTVFEISPAYGWSTNHILAALTRNGAGELHSFELLDNEERVRGNLHPEVDASRLTLHIGDARETVPAVEGAVDLVLLDSAHEAWFAEWYLAEVLPRVKGVAFVHDIVVPGGAPKHERYADGEAYAVLEWLGAHRIRAAPLFPLDPEPEQRRQSVGSVAVALGMHNPPPPRSTADRPREAIHRADHALADGDPVLAFELLEQATAAASVDTPHLLLQVAERYRRLGEIASARELAQRVVEEQRAEPLWLLQAGRALNLLGRPVAGLSAIRAAARHAAAPQWIRAASPARLVAQRLRSRAGR